jgi:glycosyltransferase involved in cell wall biosynthesis
MDVRIYQPANPRYRDDLYAQMVRIDDQLALEVIASETDFLGVRSVKPSSGYEATYPLVPVRIGAGRFLFIWYRGWPRTEPGVDAVVLDGNPRILNNYVEAVRCWWRRTPVVWWGQGFAVESRGLARRLRQWLMRSGLFAHLLLYTDVERAAYLQIGVDPTRVSALNNGIDSHAVAAAVMRWTPSALEAFRDQHRLSGMRWVVFLGRLRPRSGAEILPEVVKQLPVSVGLIIIGDGPLRASVAEHLGRLGLDARVRWAGALYDDDDLVPWMTSADCMFYPGSVGLSLIHAFAFGLPAVLNRDPVSHNPEFAAFEEGVNGISFSIEDGPRGMAHAIENVMGDATRLHRLRAAAIATVATTFNVRDMAKRFTSVLRSLRRETRGDANCPPRGAA